jgi:hypothetical protein
VNVRDIPDPEKIAIEDIVGVEVVNGSPVYRRRDLKSSDRDTPFAAPAARHEGRQASFEETQG